MINKVPKVLNVFLFMERRYYILILNSNYRIWLIIFCLFFSLNGAICIDRVVTYYFLPGLGSFERFITRANRSRQFPIAMSIVSPKILQNICTHTYLYVCNMQLYNYFFRRPITYYKKRRKKKYNLSQCNQSSQKICSSEKSSWQNFPIFWLSVGNDLGVSAADVEDCGVGGARNKPAHLDVTNTVIYSYRKKIGKEIINCINLYITIKTNITVFFPQLCISSIIWM